MSSKKTLNGSFVEIWKARGILLSLILRDLRGQYRLTVLGQLWSVINPIATMLVYTLVFSLILRAAPPPGDPSEVNSYAIWLMCGLLPWLYFVRVITAGLSSIVANASLITKVYFPRALLPFSVAMSAGVTWSVEMGVLVIALWILGANPFPWLPMVLLTMAFLGILATGIALLLSVANVYFRDTQQFIAIILPMWMFLTPIIYPITLVEDLATTSGNWLLFVYRLNPIERFVEVFRDLLYNNRIPHWPDLFASVVSALVVFLVGYLVFTKKQARFAEML